MDTVTGGGVVFVDLKMVVNRVWAADDQIARDDTVRVRFAVDFKKQRFCAEDVNGLVALVDSVKVDLPHAGGGRRRPRTPGFLFDLAIAAFERLGHLTQSLTVSMEAVRNSRRRCGGGWGLWPVNVGAWCSMGSPEALEKLVQILPIPDACPHLFLEIEVALRQMANAVDRSVTCAADRDDRGFSAPVTYPI